MVDIAETLGAKQLVVGQLRLHEGRTLIQLQLLDTKKGAVLRRVSHAFAGDLVDGARAAARKLMAVPGRLHLVNQVADADVYVGDLLVGTADLQEGGGAEGRPRVGILRGAEGRLAEPVRAGPQACLRTPRGTARAGAGERGQQARDQGREVTHGCSLPDSAFPDAAERAAGFQW